MTLDENCSEAAQAAKKEKEKKKGKNESRIFLEMRFLYEHRNWWVRGKAVTVLHTRTNLGPVSQLIRPQETGNNRDKIKIHDLSAKDDRQNCQKISRLKLSEKN